MAAILLRFPMVQKQDACHFVLFSNGLDHWKTELLATLDCFMIRWIQMYSLVRSQRATADNFTECE